MENLELASLNSNGFVDDPETIIGGTPLEPYSRPYLVLLGIFSGSGALPRCGGSLISDRVVLSAAHCFATEDGTFDPLDFMDFNRYLLSDGTGTERVNICDTEYGIGCPSSYAYAINHPDYVGPTNDGAFLDNDFTLIILPKPLSEYGLDITPVQLNSNANMPETSGDIMEAFGWGDTNPDPEVFDYPDVPMTVNLPYVTNDDCASVWYSDITSNMLCAYDADKSTCQGDSGGPLIQNTADGPIQVGELRDVLADNGFYATERELAGLMHRLDKDRDNRVCLAEWSAEFTPKLVHNM